MTFVEADAQYELIKQRYQAGELTDEQYDDELRELMVLDDLGRWWAKSRENGVWHYYDAATESWLPGSPPGVTQDPPAVFPAPTAPTPAAPMPAASTPAVGQAAPTTPAALHPSSGIGGAPGAPGARSGALPKWAAVAPATVQPPAGGSGKCAHAAAAGDPIVPPPGAAGGYSAHDFGPIPELSGSLKIVFYLLSLFVPVLGFVLFLVYRKKPAQADRSAARIFLILGVVSLVFTCLGGVAIYLLESVLLGARFLP